MTFGGELMVVSCFCSRLFCGTADGDSGSLRPSAVRCFGRRLCLASPVASFLSVYRLVPLYLATQWRRWALLLVPAVLIVSAFLMPFQVRERIVSVIYPHGNDDSNLRRVILPVRAWP